MPNAIVVGATGILGREILFEIAGEPSKWSKVYALSRSQKENYPPNVEHKHLDLTADVKEMTKELAGIEAEYVFFAAYLAQDDEGKASEVNGGMLQSFLSALRETGAEKKLKRLVLVTGAKQYGLHLGLPKQPMEESDPWIEGDDFPPNFYYTQQRILTKMASDASWDWVVTYPNDVIGAAWNNFMNLSTALALYAAVTKEMGEDLVWPGSPRFYTANTTFTSAKLHAKFCHWAIENPKCQNEGFNVINGDVVSWQNMWPKLAKRYGIKVAPDQLTRPLAKDIGSEITLNKVPPIAVNAAELGLEGTELLKPSKVENRISLAKWSKRTDVKQAWERVADKSGIDKAIWEKATWGFLDFVLGRAMDINISCNKSRAYGFLEFQDTWQALETTFAEMENYKALPRPAT